MLIITGTPLKDTQKEGVHILFKCPISLDTSFLPAITPTGQHYGTLQIRQSLARSAKDPLSRQPLTEKDIYSNNILMDLLKLYADVDKSILDTLKEQLDDSNKAVQEAQQKLDIINRQFKKYCKFFIAGVCSTIFIYGFIVCAAIFLRDYLFPEALGPLPGVIITLAFATAACCAYFIGVKADYIRNKLKRTREDAQTIFDEKTALHKLREKYLGPLLESESSTDEVIIKIPQPESQQKSTPKFSSIRSFFTNCCDGCCNSTSNKSEDDNQEEEEEPLLLSEHHN